MTLLLLPEPADDELEARHMPTMNSYDSFRVRPRYDGGKFRGRSSSYVSAMGSDNWPIGETQI